MLTKNELISLGMYDKCREDMYYLVALLYDMVKDNDDVLNKVVKEDFEYKLTTIQIPNYNGPIAKASSIYQIFSKIFKGKFTLVRRNSNGIENNGAGIYGIYIGQTLIYIGSSTNLAHRFSQHKFHINNDPNNSMYLCLQQAKKDGKQIYMKILVDLSKESHQFSIDELRAMEYGLIKVLQPQYNYAGVYSDFYKP